MFLVQFESLLCFMMCLWFGVNSLYSFVLSLLSQGIVESHTQTCTRASGGVISDQWVDSNGTKLVNCDSSCPDYKMI